MTMTQVQTLTTGGQITWLTRTTLVIEASIAEIRDVLAAAERSNRLKDHGETVAVAGEPGIYLVNVRLIPRPEKSRAVVPAVRRTAVATRPQGVVVKRSTDAKAAIAVGSIIALGAAGWGCVEVYEWIAEYFVAILGVGVTVLAVLLIGVGRRRASCSGVHVKH
jgi:hypothetical protein